MNQARRGGNLGIWIWDLARNDIWANDSWREHCLASTPSEHLDLDGVLQRLHPDDRQTPPTSAQAMRSRCGMEAITRSNTG